MRIGSIIIFHASKLYEKPTSSYCVMYFFWWGCRGNLRLIALGGGRVEMGNQSTRLLRKVNCARRIRQKRPTILAKMCGTPCLFPELLQYSLAPPWLNAHCKNILPKFNLFL